MGVCKCSMFCCTLIYAHSSIAIILIGKRELVSLLIFSSWCLAMVEWLFLAVSWGCLRFVIVVFPDHTHLLFSMYNLVSFFSAVATPSTKQLKFEIYIVFVDVTFSFLLGF